ncbi:MAG: hypothetical protein MJ146_03625 [Clostridia bacterium]|nr:hypothetical protein [Clostridia bacterium]
MKKGLAICLCTLFGIITLVNLSTMVLGPKATGLIPLVADGYISGTDVSQGDLLICRGTDSDVRMENGRLIFSPDTGLKNSIVFTIKGAGNLCQFFRTPLGIALALVAMVGIMRKKEFNLGGEER